MIIDLRKIPAVYMNLEQHTAKNKNMQDILSICGFENIIRVEGTYMPDKPISGCAAAHYNALQEVDPPFILFEDDCMPKNFKPMIEIPNDADAVYLGISSWGRMNGHSGPFVKYTKVGRDFYRVYNMLSGHAILYLTPEYVNICKKIAYHSAYIVEDYYHDIGFAEIQRWFNVYAFDDPMFYQTSGYHGTVNALSSYPTHDCMSFDFNHFLPQKII